MPLFYAFQVAVAWFVYRSVRSGFTKNGMVLIRDLESDSMFNDQQLMKFSLKQQQTNDNIKFSITDVDEEEELIKSEVM